MTQRRYPLRQRQQRPNSPWAALLIPLIAIIITGVAFYILASALGGGAAPPPTPTPIIPPTAIPTATPTPELVTATPTPEPVEDIPTPTPAPLPSVLQVGSEATVNAESGLRVRGGPGTAFEAVATLPPGTVVTITEGPERADTYTWWKISFTNADGTSGEGWAAGDFLDPGAG